VIIDAYSHVCPERLLDAISARHPSAEVAALRKNSYLFDGERRLRFMDRIGVDQQVLVLVRPSEQLPGRPSDYFRKFFNDSMVNGSAAAMRCGLEFFGPERVMYGTDFPMGSSDGEDWPIEVLDTIRSLDLSRADQDLVLGANLRRIMRL
jgi:hypothetical protein